MSGLKDNASKYLSKIAGFVGAIPPIPSGEDKNLLRQLEKMKVGDPTLFKYIKYSPPPAVLPELLHTELPQAIQHIDNI